MPLTDPALLAQHTDYYPVHTQCRGALEVRPFRLNDAACFLIVDYPVAYGNRYALLDF